jgi:hypothetical protein
MVGNGTADPTVWTYGIDSLGFSQRDLNRQGFVEQSTSRTHGCTFPARDTGGLPHWEVQIKADMGLRALPGPANDFVVLDIVTTSDAAIT